jgi:uncharacterized RDD family membrane protein YckC
MEPLINQSPMTQQAEVTYAGFWKRFLAYIIDSFILSCASLLIIIPVVITFGVGAFTQHEIGEEAAMGFLIALIGAYFVFVVMIIIGHWLYFALMESKKGATLGKMALGVIVTDLNGNPISFGKATGRYFGKILSSLIFCVGYIMAGFTQQKQALHDILAGCLVVNKK